MEILDSSIKLFSEKLQNHIKIIKQVKNALTLKTACKNNKTITCWLDLTLLRFCLRKWKWREGKEGRKGGQREGGEYCVWAWRRTVPGTHLPDPSSNRKWSSQSLEVIVSLTMLLCLIKAASFTELCHSFYNHFNEVKQNVVVTLV